MAGGASTAYFHIRIFRPHVAYCFLKGQLNDGPRQFASVRVAEQRDPSRASIED